MKLSHAAVYAVHALTHLAGRPQGELVASHVIAAASGMPERFLLKVLKPLVSAQVLFSVKGPRGGYRLARQPKAVNLLEIVEAADGPLRGDAPPVGLPGGDRVENRLRSIMDSATDLERKQLSKVTLADLAAENGPKPRRRKPG